MKHLRERKKESRKEGRKERKKEGKKDRKKASQGSSRNLFFSRKYPLQNTITSIVYSLRYRMDNQES
jgi:hypothetical protein